MRLTFVLLVVLSPILGCAHGPGGGPDPTTLPGPPTLDQLASATYRGIQDRPVALVSGTWEGAPFHPDGAARPTVTLVDSVAPTGDLDGDGSPETVAVLAATGAGTGSNIYLAAMRATRDGLENVATALIGDRVQLISLAIDGGILVGELVQTREGEAMCCPTARVRRSWKLEGARLVELRAEDRGTVSIADLAGTWKLVELPGGQLPNGVTVTITFKGNDVTGSAGCNTYSGSFTETKPRELEPGLFATTQKFCNDEAMQVESAYFRALGLAKGYSFRGTRLGIDYALSDVQTATMLFVREK
jgi:heat shock protein HslJ